MMNDPPASYLAEQARKDAGMALAMQYFNDAHDLLEYLIQTLENHHGNKPRYLLNWYIALETYDGINRKQVTVINKKGLAAHEFHALHHYAGDIEQALYNEQYGKQ